MEDNLRECTYCGGRGYIFNSLIEKEMCSYCFGTGTLKVKEKRKSILVSLQTHKKIRDFAYDHKMSIVEFIDYMVRHYKIKEK